MLRVLLPIFETVVCARYENNLRGYVAKDLCELAKTTCSELGLAIGDDISVCESPREAWKAVAEGCPPDELICVTGSFFIASEVRELILDV